VIVAKAACDATAAGFALRVGPCCHRVLEERRATFQILQLRLEGRNEVALLVTLWGRQRVWPLGSRDEQALLCVCRRAFGLHGPVLKLSHRCLHGYQLCS
jgi:hypothetical protein